MGELGSENSKRQKRNDYEDDIQARNSLLDT